MGGHGGLNILPQKRWNVYNFDNREKVRKDEEAAAREEQLKQDQSRKRDAEFRLQILRQANRSKRGFETQESSTPQALAGVSDSSQTLKEEIAIEAELNNSDSNHINLFEGWNGFQMEGEKGDNKKSDRKEKGKDNRNDDYRPEKKQKKKREGEESVRAVLPEDEIYRLGYGVAGKDAKTPWYLSKSFAAQQDEEDHERLARERRSNSKESSQRNGEIMGKKKSLLELREERLKREHRERERAQKLLFPNAGVLGIKHVNSQNRAPYYNSGYGNAR